MKPITLILLLPTLLFMYLVHVTRLKAITPPSHAVHITRQITDERGLTSLQFAQDGKEWGLDYLTKQELDSLTSIK